jgi:hypothetical protein
VKVWDVAHGADNSASFGAHGLVQAVCVDGANTILCGTSKGSIHMFDLRARDGAVGAGDGGANDSSVGAVEAGNGSGAAATGLGGTSWLNTGRAMVNALVVADTLLLTGDSRGDLRTW